jgi:hypothetical protein
MPATVTLAVNDWGTTVPQTPPLRGTAKALPTATAFPQKTLSLYTEND